MCSEPPTQPEARILGQWESDHYLNGLVMPDHRLPQIQLPYLPFWAEQFRWFSSGPSEGCGCQAAQLRLVVLGGCIW
jgi:hypothetical protein